MKKITMAVATAALLTSAYADNCASAFSGFYAGVQAGVAGTNGSLKGSNISTLQAAPAYGVQKNNVGDKSFVGGLLAGYGMGVGSCAYIGGELYVNFDSFSTKATNADSGFNAFNIKLDRQYNVGGKVRFGYTVSPQAMVFLGLGLEYSRLRIKATNIGGALDGFNGALTKKSKASMAFAPSVGMDLFMSKNMFLRGEYTYVVGMKSKVDAQQKNVNAANRVTTATYKANLDQQRFMLAIGYKF